MAKLTFKNDLIDAGTPFWFKVSNIKNPPFTRPITVKQLTVLDYPDNVIIQQYSIKPFPTVVMS